MIAAGQDLDAIYHDLSDLSVRGVDSKFHPP